MSLVQNLGRAAKCTRSTCNLQHAHLQWTEKRNGVHGRWPEMAGRALERKFRNGMRSAVSLKPPPPSLYFSESGAA